LLLVGVPPSFLAVLFPMVLCGATRTALQTLTNIVALRHTEHDYIGRVIGLGFLGWGANALVGLPIGILADAIGERNVLLCAGSMLIGVSVMLGLWGRSIDRTEARAGAPV